MSTKMRKLYLVISLMFLWCLVFGVPRACAFGPTMYTGTGAGGAPTPPSCIAPTEDVANTTQDNTLDVYDYKTIGQSWQPTVTKDCYSVKVKCYSPAGASGTLTVRIDDDTDMSSEYLAVSDEVAIVPNATTEYTFTFSTIASLIASSTYYFAVGDS